MTGGDNISRAQQAAPGVDGRSKRRPYAVLGDIEALPSRLPTLYRRLTE